MRSVKNALLSLMVLGFMVSPGFALANYGNDGTDYSSKRKQDKVIKKSQHSDRMKTNRTDMKSSENTRNMNRNESNTFASSKNNVMKVQKALSKKGFDAGPVDGYIGPRTRDAISEFQLENSLTATGSINQETLGALDINFDGSDMDMDSETYSE